LTAADKLYVNCSAAKDASGPINAGTVYFNGTVSPTASLSMPNAHHVYINGSSSVGISVGNSGTFSMNTTGHLDATTGNCMDAPSLTASKAALFVRSGTMGNSGGGLIRMCSTTVYMMGGQADGCTPAAYADISSAPAPKPSCSGSTAGNGIINTSGGNFDWTAPNKYDEMTTDSGQPIPARAAEWTDPPLGQGGQEDLALWDETFGTSTGSDYKFTGGGTFHVRGVFMVPNGVLQLSGTATFDLKNAQFVSTSLALASANTKLIMSVDPNSAVTIPRTQPGLVR
jgi:hypothetical protein